MVSGHHGEGLAGPRVGDTVQDDVPARSDGHHGRPAALAVRDDVVILGGPRSRLITGGGGGGGEVEGHNKYLILFIIVA